MFCRQRQDERLRRGAEQKSVVVLSEHPFSSILGPLSQHLGPLFFNDGVGALQAVYQEVLQWPTPLYGLRGVLAAGSLSLPVSLPPPATLPPPCPFDVLDDEGQVPGIKHVPGQTMLGLFQEVHSAEQLLHECVFGTCVLSNAWGCIDVHHHAHHHCAAACGPLISNGPRPHCADAGGYLHAVERCREAALAAVGVNGAC